MYTDWRYTKYAGYYHPRTFTHIKRNNTTDVNKTFRERKQPKAGGKFFFASNVDIEKYNDKPELIHLAVLSSFYMEFYTLFPTELFYFSVLFLMPKLDEKPEKNSALSEIVNDPEVRSQLMILKREYEKQKGFRIKNILSFGKLSCKRVCKEEFELYRLIRERTVAGNFRCIYIHSGLDFSPENDNMKIPKDILAKVPEHEFNDVYSYYPESELVDLCFKQKINSYDHLRKAKKLLEKDPPKVNTKYIKRKFSSEVTEIRLFEIIIAVILSYPTSWLYLRAFRYRSTMYLAFFDTIMEHFMFSDIMYFILLGMLYLFIRSGMSRTILSPSCYFAENRIVCKAISGIEQDGGAERRSLRQNYELHTEHLYTYTYSSIRQYGIFRRMGKKYFYFSKKLLTDEELNRFRNKMILCDENTVAMSYDEKIYELAKQIIPPKKQNNQINSL